jgi:molybdate transport system substrate-binding protein
MTSQSMIMPRKNGSYLMQTQQCVRSNRIGFRFRFDYAITWCCFALLLACGCGPRVKPPPIAKPSETGTASSPKVASPSRELTVAAAFDLKFALDEILAAFEKEQPDARVKVSYGSSGNFFAQLSNKAPFDLFFSADIEYPRKLIEQGLAAKETEFQYAVGHLVLWVPNLSKLDVERLGIEAMTDPAVRKIAIANPKHAPYGRAALAALKSLGVYERVEERLVLGENIAQTAQLVETGAADVGLLALSLVMAPAMRDKGRYWPVPQDAHPPLEQGGIMLSWAKDQEAARRLRAFVMGDAGRAILKQYGFALPSEAVTE